MLLHYLKVAVRQLLKYRTQNLISIIGLGVCLLCFSVCLYVGRFILTTNHCFENRDRIASIELLDETGMPFGNALAHRLAAQLPAGVEAVTYINMSDKRDYTLTLPGGEELPYQGLSVLEVDTAFQRVFGAEVIAGSWEAAVRTQNAIILTERMARRIFAQPAEAIGRLDRPPGRRHRRRGLHRAGRHPRPARQQLPDGDAPRGPADGERCVELPQRLPRGGLYSATARRTIS